MNNELIHNIKNKLQAIVGYTELAKKLSSDNKKIDEYLKKISNSTEDVIKICNELQVVKENQFKET